MFDIFEKVETQNKGNKNKDLDKYKKDNKGKDLDKEWTYQEVWDEVLYSGNVLPKTLTEAHRVVIVDADDVVFRVSAACEKRSVLVTIKGVELEFPTHTDLKKYCKRNGEDYNKLTVEDKYKTKRITVCLDILRKAVRNIYKELDATHVVFILGGGGNFRLDLPLPTRYKSLRKDSRRPDHLKACRDYLNKNYNTFIVSGVEADDIVQGMTEYIINKTRAYGVAYNRDKDYHTAMNKNTYFHSVDKQLVELSGGVGSLRLVGTKVGKRGAEVGGSVRGDGLHWLLFQISQGDLSDDYNPKQFFNIGLGEKNYFKIFSEYTDAKKLLAKWVEVWEGNLPEIVKFTTWNGVEVEHDWLSLVNLYFKAPYMLTHPNDTTTFSDLLERYGVEYD